MKERSRYYMYEAMDFSTPSEATSENENGNVNNHVKRRVKVRKPAGYPN